MILFLTCSSNSFDVLCCNGIAVRGITVIASVLDSHWRCFSAPRGPAACASFDITQGKL